MAGLPDAKIDIVRTLVAGAPDKVISGLRNALAAAEGRYERAAELLGVSDSLRGRPDRSNPDAPRLAERLRAELGEEGYAAAYARGNGRSRADALAFVGGDPAG